MVEATASPDRSSVVAAVLSAVLPGAGQLYAGAKRRGWTLLGIDGLLLLIAFLVATDSSLRLTLGFDVTALGAAIFANVLLLAYRAWAADDAAKHIGATGPLPLMTLLGGFAVVAVVVLLPHLAVGSYTMIQYNVITEVFAPTDVAAATNTTPPDAEAVVAGDASGDGTRSTIVNPSGPPIWDGLERLNLLLLGADTGAGRDSIRTDTMIVVSIDPLTGDTAMLSVPRNFVNVPLPEGMGAWECDCFPRLLNDLYVAGIESPGAFPGPQAPEVNAIKGGIGNLLGIQIHYYAMVTLDGFVGLVDALGGVDIDVQFNIVDEDYPHENGVDREYIDIPVGPNRFDGHMALAYARIRRNANDYARMQRQRCVLEAVLEQSSPLELAAAYPRIAGVLIDALETDIPQSRLRDFIGLVAKIDTNEIVTLRFIPPTYVSGSNERGNFPDVELIREHTRLATTQDPRTVIEALQLESLDSTCA